jgi:site-specific recombinase XerD
VSYYTATETEVYELLKKPDLDTVKGRRDRAILELLYSSGLRRMEIFNLNVDDLDFDEGLAVVRRGKGQKDRMVPFGAMAKKSLRLYLEKSRLKWLKDKNNKALFISERGERLSKYMIYDVVKQYATNKKIGVHSLRHSCATHMLKRGASLMHLKELLGHSDLKTTQMYTRLMPLELKELYEQAGLRRESEDNKKSGNPSFRAGKHSF